jgi:hypothetical protein
LAATYVVDTDYTLGSIVNAGSGLYSYQCIGFVGKSGDTEPVWPTVEGTIIADGQLTWLTELTSDTDLNFNWNEYFDITPIIKLS